jgi:putative transposase
LILTYKYRIKDKSARKALDRHAYAANQVWNYAVAQQRDVERRYRAGEKPRRWASHFDLQRLCKGVGKELGLHQQSVGGVCRAFAEARDKLKHAPRFRSSFGTKRALGWIPFEAQSRQVEGNSVWYLGKRYRWFGNKRRPLPETAKGGCFVEDALGRWWVCFVVEVADKPVACGGAIGIDLGLKTLATLSDGTKVENLRHRRTWAQKLATAQRARNKRRTAAIHARITNARKDHLHKFTTGLAARYALIAVGNVNSKKLAKTRMAKSVLDAGWSTLRSFLRYKSPGYVEVDEKFTTQTCSGCGSIAGPKGRAGLNKRRWVCGGCGASHDRDVNSAVNILRLGLSAQARGDESRRAA